MTRLTRDKIGKLLDNQAIGNFSSLASLSKKNNSNKLSLHNNNKQKNIETKDLKNIGINRSIETENIDINQKESIVVENIMEEATTLNYSVSNPLAMINNKTTINILPKAPTDELATKFIKDNEIPALDGEDNYYYAKPAMGANKIFKQETTKEFVSNSLATDSIPLSADYNSVPFNMADTLAGKGLTLVMYLIDLCKQNCSLVTPPVFTKDLLQVVCIKPTHLRNLILRLSEKKIFKVLLHKSSKHAIRIFEFEKNTYASLTKRKLNVENNSNFNLTENRSSIDLLNIKDHEQLKNLAKPFKNIDLSPLEIVGFNETHLIQIYKEYEKYPNKTLSEEILQHSIDAFAFDLKHNHITESFKSSPAVVLLSLLKKGIPYSSRTPDKFLTPQEEALQHYLANKQQKIKVQEEQENKLKEVEFFEWYNGLTEQKIVEIIGDKANGLVGSKIMKEKSIRGWLVQHFDSEVWPSKRKQVIEQIQSTCKVD